MKKAIKTALTDKMLKQEEILNQYGFSFQTKVFWNIVNDNWKIINDFKEVILSFGFSEGNALVYAVIVTNYHLNGANIKFSQKSTNGFSSQRLGLNKASYLLSNASIGEKFAAFKTFIMSVKTETYDKYLYCLNELRQMNYVEHKIPTVSEIKTAIKTQIKPHFKSIARLPKAKELTVQQIEQLLGYKIKIVG